MDWLLPFGYMNLVLLKNSRLVWPEGTDGCIDVLEKSRYMSGKPHKVWYNKYKARKWDNVRNGCWRIAHSHILSKRDKQR